jgi:hypothetical protein
VRILLRICGRRLMGPQSVATHCFNYTTPERTQLPLIENSFNNCQGHPPLCLPPGTAQRLPDRIQTMFGRAAIYSIACTLSHFLKLNSNICGNPLAFSLTFNLQYLSELYLGTHLPGSNINGNKIKSEHGSHIRIHTTHNLIMFTYNICKPDNKCRVNTDLPPLKSGRRK